MLGAGCISQPTAAFTAEYTCWRIATFMTTWWIVYHSNSRFYLAFVLIAEFDAQCESAQAPFWIPPDAVYQPYVGGKLGNTRQ